MNWLKQIACEWNIHSTKVKVESSLSGRCRCLWCGKETYPFGFSASGFMLEEMEKPHTSTKPKGRSGWGGVSNSFKNWWKSL